MKINIIDSNFICHKARYTTRQLSYKGKGTGVIYGFLSQLYSLGRDLRPDETIFVWDSRKSKRKRRYPFYKDRQHSDDTPDETIEDDFAQFSELRRYVLPELGFNMNHIQNGYEGDDIIAKIVMVDGGHRYTVIANDEDFYQLLDYMNMYRGKKAKGNKNKKYVELMTKDIFIEQYGIQPTQWVLVKQIAGCKSDTVPGVRGVGNATAAKYLRGDLSEKSKKWKDIQEYQAIIERNEWLVKLPLPGTKMPKWEPSVFTVDNLKRVCKEYGFFKLLKDHNKLDEWEIFYGN